MIELILNNYTGPCRVLKKYAGKKFYTNTFNSDSRTTRIFFNNSTDTELYKIYGEGGNFYTDYFILSKKRKLLFFPVDFDLTKVETNIDVKN